MGSAVIRELIKRSAELARGAVPGPVPEVVTSPAPRPLPRTALVVDDSRMIRKVSRKFLEELGYEVGEAENGREALDRCKAAIAQGGLPGLILLDWNMPVMSGIEFVAALRALAEGDRPKVVFCTTNSDAPAIEAALRGGTDGYVVKPFTAETLQAQLQHIRAL